MSSKKACGPAEVLKAIQDIGGLVDQGYSIQYARKHVCGGNYASLTIEVKKHFLYQQILNKYMADRGYRVRFARINGTLTCVGEKFFSIAPQ